MQHGATPSTMPLWPPNPRIRTRKLRHTIRTGWARSALAECRMTWTRRPSRGNFGEMAVRDQIDEIGFVGSWPPVLLGEHVIVLDQAPDSHQLRHYTRGSVHQMHCPIGRLKVSKIGDTQIAGNGAQLAH